MSTVIANPSEIYTPQRKLRPMLLVFISTLFGAPASIIIKSAANHVPQHVNWFAALIAMATNLPLVAGYSLLGVSFFLMTLALKDGELSILYPVIALTQVWVTILSVWIFHDSMNPYKIAGVGAVVLGVGVLGWSGK